MGHETTEGPAGVRAFFAARAAGWDAKFAGDGPRYAAAVAAMRLPEGAAVLDAGCGTGRALPALREAVGPGGLVLGADLTPEMLEVAAHEGRDAYGTLLLADAARLPLRDGGLDAVFAAGLVSHMRGQEEGLRELARVVRPRGTLALFHPIGRAALAARKGHTLGPDDARAEPNLRPLLAAAGWRLTSYEDEPERYLALAERA
ncbi:class I SAM-dependent methyltransferase [Streptomyces sp. ODS28]|uniref:class I SAM-dependent methyltransferase n=1 Tax=Streptomyces sp. ODS28 TaxID=3136688 RepID=UPI0031E7E8CE